MAARKTTREANKPFGPKAPRFTAPPEAVAYFSDSGKELDRRWKIEDLLLEAVGLDWAREEVPYRHVKEKMSGVGVEEVKDAGRKLLRDRRVHLVQGKAYRTDRSGIIHSTPLTPVASSNVKAVGYYAARTAGVHSVLAVSFLSGTTYFYDLPAGYFKAMMAAPSKGKYLHWEIKVKNVPYDGPYSI